MTINAIKNSTIDSLHGCVSVKLLSIGEHFAEFNLSSNELTIFKHYAQGTIKIKFTSWSSCLYTILHVHNIYQIHQKS